MWLIPFLMGFLFFDQEGNLVISEIFKSIMIVIGSMFGVIFGVAYFRDIKEDYLKEGVILGIVWLIVNWVCDLMMVLIGFLPLSI